MKSLLDGVIIAVVAISIEHSSLPDSGFLTKTFVGMMLVYAYFMFKGNE